jgi:hypothetical protein
MDQDSISLNHDKNPPGYEAAVIQGATDSMSEKRQFWPTALGIVFIINIGFFIGYLYYTW